MSSKAVILLSICLYCTTARPVKKTLNFNMFVLPHDGAEKTVLTTDGVSRFGPVLEYLVQRVQGMLSVKVTNEVLDGPEPEIEDPSSDQVPGNGTISVDANENLENGSTSTEGQPSIPTAVPIADAAENEVDYQVPVPGVVVRPSQTKPGTFEVEIAVVVDDEQFKNP